MLDHVRDAEATAAKHYHDPDSYVSQDGHEYLAGHDIMVQRARVYDRDRGRCVKCDKYIPWPAAHMHHKESGLGPQRCWCTENLEILCPDCHRKEHVQVANE
jgi:hypothetical protein